MRRSRWFRVSAYGAHVAAMVAVSACGTGGPRTGGSLPPMPTDNRADENDRWARVAQTVPGGFGGYFVRGGGRETIYLTDPSKREAAIAALNVQHINGTLIGPDAVAERARWDYVQL